MWALLPLKNFAQAKQRLSAVLTPTQRCGLFQSMVQDVLAMLQSHPDIENTLIVSEDPRARLMAYEYGAEFLFEPALKVSGLNPSIQAAVSELSLRGVDDVMIIHGDLPLISSVELSQLVCAHRAQGYHALTIAPDDRRDGSNCLLCTPASSLIYCYGTNSFSKYVEQSCDLGMSLQVIASPGFACDIDTPEDLVTLFERVDASNAPHTYRYISANGLFDCLRILETPHFNNVERQYGWAS